jgi:hypothetical protein
VLRAGHGERGMTQIAGIAQRVTQIDPVPRLKRRVLRSERYDLFEASTVKLDRIPGLAERTVGAAERRKDVMTI